MAQTLAHCASLLVLFISTGQGALAALTKLLTTIVRKCFLGGRAHLMVSGNPEAHPVSVSSHAVALWNP